MKVSELSAPAMLTWQLTRDCNLACLHCCTDSAPGRALPDELSREQALGLADQIVAAGVPYVMIAGGEPTIVAHFRELAERLGRGGVYLKIESNGQGFGEAEARWLKALPIRSLQVSIDGATAGTYGRMRPGGELKKALGACRAAVSAGLPLELTFAPARFNIAEAEAVIELAAGLGAFRFNTGKLMRLGTAARLWDRLEPDARQYDDFYRLLLRKEKELVGRMELCFRPFSLEEEFEGRTKDPPGTLLILPDGKVKVAAPLPFVCADLRKVSLTDAWREYKAAWQHPEVRSGLRCLIAEPMSSAQANVWSDLPALVGR